MSCQSSCTTNETVLATICLTTITSWRPGLMMRLLRVSSKQSSRSREDVLWRGYIAWNTSFGRGTAALDWIVEVTRLQLELLVLIFCFDDTLLIICAFLHSLIASITVEVNTWTIYTIIHRKSTNERSIYESIRNKYMLPGVKTLIKIIG